ncbi:prepilin peptidase [Salmonella sp. SAL04157]|uniref:prepilin peptidase n=1 Tax=Salmonella sp. SAL04157 TaxID=3159777 RepID=UPI0039798C46|nr:prepilin peptidase [Salmonella enterica]
MNLWTWGLTFALLCLSLFLQLRQVNAFLHEHDAPPLPSRLSDIVSLLFLLLGMFLVYQGNFPALLMFSALLPLLWLDSWQHWLPLRFTNAFWFAGLLVRLLPDGETLPLLQALFNSTVMFCLMWGVWWSVKRLCKREALGRGDVHLIAGLFAWLPATSALYSCGLAFLMMLVAVARKPQPLAPWLCLSLVAGLFIGDSLL